MLSIRHDCNILINPQIETTEITEGKYSIHARTEYGVYTLRSDLTQLAAAAVMDNFFDELTSKCHYANMVIDFDELEEC